MTDHLSDTQIIEALEIHGPDTAPRLAARINREPSALLRRLRRLQKQGHIYSYQNPDPAGPGARGTLWASTSDPFRGL